MKWIAGVCLMALIVGVAATMTVPAATVTLDRNILKLFPRETQGIGFIDVAALRTAPLLQEFLSRHQPTFDGTMGEVLEATGFTPARDLDRVTGGRLGEREILVVIEARYDRLKFEEFMRDKNVAPETYQGWPLYGNAHNAVALVDNLLIAGNPAAVRGAIERRAAPAPSVLDNAELLASIGSIDGGNQIWAAGRFTIDQLPLPRRRPAQADVLLKDIQGGTYQMRIDQDLQGRATGDFATPENAKAVADALSSLLSVMKLQMARQADLQKLLEGIQLNIKGQELTVNFQAPGELIRKLPILHRRAVE